MRRNTAMLGRRNSARFGLVAAALIACAWASVLPASAVTFDPNKIISDDNMRDYGSMTTATIQAFLETQPGPLKSLVTADYDHTITLSKTKDNSNTTPDKGEKPKRASLIIWEACQAWKINPKVMLTMLQKEQSLLTRTSLKSTTLARAIGAGCPGHVLYPKTNPVATNKYPGFGNQMWFGARLLDGYGEGKNGSTIPLYHAGIATKDIYRNVTLHPKNLATYKLYIYNPSIGAKAPYGDLSAQAGKCSGNANFWLIYRKYFGDPLASPRMRPVYRFKKNSNGTYLYTTSLAERYRLQASKKMWHFDGAAFSCDSSASATSTVPMYRFYNKKTRKYSYVTSHSKYVARTTATGKKTWKYGGIAFRVGKAKSSGAITVWRFENRRNGAQFLTAASATRAKMRSSTALKKTWRYRGVAFYLPRVPSSSTSTTTP